MTDNGDDGSAGNLAQIRAAVRALCGKFPGEYWRQLDRERAYPGAFVKALTEAGYLAALIPEDYGGSGLDFDRGLHPFWRRSTPAAATAPPAMPRCTPWGRSCGTARRSEIARPSLDRARRAAAAGLRGDRADLWLRHAEPRHHGPARGRPLRHQRTEGVDLARRTFRSHAAHRPHHAARGRPRCTHGLSVFLIDMRAGRRHQHRGSIRSAP